MKNENELSKKLTIRDINIYMEMKEHKYSSEWIIQSVYKKRCFQDLT